jgi:hypothetical protein
MAYNYAINDDVLFQFQGPQGRAVPKQRDVYTIIARMPIEADGRPRYRIKSKTEKESRARRYRGTNQPIGVSVWGRGLPGSPAVDAISGQRRRLSL